MGKGTDGSADSEQDRIVLELSKSIVPQQDTRVGIYIRVRVGNLSVFLQNAGHDRVNGVDNLEQFVVGHVLQGEFSLAGVTRVGLSQNSMSVSGDDLLGIEGVPGEFGDSFGGDFLSFGFEFGLEVLDPLEDLLVGQTVKRSGKGVQSSGIREVRIGEGGSDQVGSVGRSISSLVVSVDAQVQTHELVERRIVVSKHSAEVTGIIQGSIFVDNTIEVNVSVNHSSNLWQNGDNTQNILEGVDVVVGLRGASGVGLSELGLGLAGVKTNAQLSHRVHVLWKAVDQSFDVLGELGTRVQFGG